MPNPIDLIRELYQEYRFINPSEASEGVAGTEAIAIWKNNMEAIVRRSYEDAYQWYFLTFKPLNNPYEKDKAWYSKYGIDKCRKMIRSPAAYLFTREIEAEKEHINALICTDYDLTYKHDSVYCNKYKIYCKRLTGYADRIRVLNYIMKEAKGRPFKKYVDYLFYDRHST